MLTERCHVVLVELLGLLVHFDFLLALKLESLAYRSRHVFGGILQDDWLKANLLFLLLVGHGVVLGSCSSSSSGPIRLKLRKGACLGDCKNLIDLHLNVRCLVLALMINVHVL